MKIKLLKERLHPPTPPMEFMIDKTTSKFKNQILNIIYNNYDGFLVQYPLSRYSHDILISLALENGEMHLSPGNRFDSFAFYRYLESCNDYKFFEALDAMLQIIGIEYFYNLPLQYTKMINDINEKMRENGIGYQIENCYLIPSTEPIEFEEIIEPCLIELVKNNLYDADNYIKSAFKHYKNGNYADAITDAAKCLENVIASVINKKNIVCDVEKEKLPEKIDKVMKQLNLPKQITEHLKQLTSIIQTPMSIRNDVAAHGSIVYDINPSLVKFTIDTVCSDVLLIVRMSFNKK